MPIYAYRCDACGFAKDVLQKMSEDPLTVCPECNQPAFKKQVTAAGFQLKGSGWYVTDFRGGNTNKESAATSASTKTEAKSGDAAPAVTTTTTDNSTSTNTNTNNTPTPTSSSSDKAA